MKKFLTTLLTIGLVIALPIVAFATAITILQQLKEEQPLTYVNYVKDEAFPTDGDQSKIITIGDSEEPIFWHFIDPSKSDFVATIVFSNENDEITTVEELFSYKAGQHYGVITPPDFKIEDAWLNGETERFVLSHVATTPTTTETTIETTPTTTSTTTETIPTTTGTTTETTSTTITETTIETTPTTTETTVETTATTSTETTQTTTTENTQTTATTTSPTTPTITGDIPKTGEVEDFQMTVIGATFLALAAALAIWKKRIKQ